MSVEDIQETVQKVGNAFTEFKGHYSKRLDDIERKMNLARMNGGDSTDAPKGYTPEEHKSLTQAIRAYVGGDQARGDKFLRESIEEKGMQTGIDSQGGYLVQPTLSAGMTRVMLEWAPFINYARTVTIEGDVFEEPIDKDEVGATWVGETQSRPDTDTPELGMFSCPVREIYAMPKATQKLLDTSNRDVVGWLEEKAGEKFAAAELDAFMNGDGIAKPRGVCTYPVAETGDATRPWGTIEIVKTGVNGDFPVANNNPSDKLIDLKSKLKAQYRNEAVWLMSRETEARIQKFKDGNGMYIWNPGLSASSPSILLGHPIILVEQMPALATGSLSVAFGNFKKAYTIVRRLGVRLLVDPYTDKPNVRLYVYQRVGGDVNNTEAIKFLQFSA